MRHFFIIIIFFVFSLLFQAALPHFPGPSCRLEIPLLLLFYICFTSSFLEGGIEVLVLGFLLEAWSVPIPGLMTLSYLIVFMVVKVLQNHLFLEGVFIRGAWAVFLFLFQKGLLVLSLPDKVLFHSPFLLIVQSLLHGLIFMGFFVLVFRGEEWFRRRWA